MPVPALIPALISSVISNAGTPSAPPAMPPGMVQMRALPDGAKTGRLTLTSGGIVNIDGTVLALSPAAQIRNEMNMIVAPVAIEQPTPVRYLTDVTGMVWRIWILTPAEVAASR